MRYTNKRQKQNRRRYYVSYALRIIGVSLAFASVITLVGIAGSIDTETITDLNIAISMSVKCLFGVAAGFCLTIPYREWFGQ